MVESNYDAASKLTGGRSSQGEGRIRFTVRSNGTTLNYSEAHVISPPPHQAHAYEIMNVSSNIKWCASKNILPEEDSFCIRKRYLLQKKKDKEALKLKWLIVTPTKLNWKL
ncbi:hypothetical protein YC2023_122494 [Brassica napus]